MKVIVMGNAPSVLLNEFGSTIDTFDKVIRMNDYKISGFEKHVGTKTDIYVRSHNPEYPMKDASEYDEVWLKSQWKRWRGLGLVPFTDMKSPNIELITESRWDTNRVGGKNTKTTGIRAIEMAIDKFYTEGNPIYIYGFTFFNANGDMKSVCNRPHYYMEEPPNMYYSFMNKKMDSQWDHVFHKERDLVKNLIAEGKVKALFPEEISGDIDMSQFEDCIEYIPKHLANRKRPGNRFKGTKYGPEGYVKQEK